MRTIALPLEAAATQDGKIRADCIDPLAGYNLGFEAGVQGFHPCGGGHTSIIPKSMS
jgi:hypothetical protein